MRNKFESSNTNKPNSHIEYDQGEQYVRRRRIVAGIGAIALTATLGAGIAVAKNIVNSEKSDNSYSLTTKTLQPGQTAWDLTTESGNGYYNHDNQDNVAEFNADNKDGAMADNKLQAGETVVVRVDNQANNPK